MQRTIVPTERYRSEEISRGVRLESFYPGGMKGPNNECLLPTPGGQGWSDMLMIGGDDAFQMMVPDIRMPPNQYWPMHWHDCWTVVLLLEGQCCIGDWWMQPGDVFVTIPSLEYGPLLVGPEGCRLFEIFAKAHLAPGGYGPEYHDHPTLVGSVKNFAARSALNRRNEGRQTLPCDGVEGIWKYRLDPGLQLDLGEREDPDRGVLAYRQLSPGEIVAPHSHDDWNAWIVMEGSLQIAGRTLNKDDYLVIEPDSPVAGITAGPNGASILQLARTAHGAENQQLPAVAEQVVHES